MTEQAKRRGRPKLPEGQRLKSLSVMLPQDVLDALEVEAAERGLTMGAVIREILERWHERRERGSSRR